jgi:hypothetical protein
MRESTQRVAGAHLAEHSALDPKLKGSNPATPRHPENIVIGVKNSESKQPAAGEKFVEQ